MNDVVQEILKSPTAVVAVIAAVLAFVGGVLGPLIQLIIGWRQTKVALASVAAAKSAGETSLLAVEYTGTREVAKMRIAWMDKLRETLAEYHSIMMTIEEDKIDEQRLSLLGTELDLLLNQNDTPQHQLWLVADKMFLCKDKAHRRTMDKELILAARVVFKTEWEKVKSELQGKRFLPSNANVAVSPVPSAG